MRTFITLFLLAFISTAVAQHPADACLEKNDKTLEQRFAIMKEKSETFNEYKVIKAYILDGMWNITRDSINHQKQLFTEATHEITRLNSQLNSTLAALKQKEESMEDVVHASTHINVFGVDFGKNVFIGTFIAVIVGLLVVIGAVSGRLRMMYKSLKEKIDLENTVSQEFENYKRKALEKQMKLSRELQDERNRLEELRGISTN